MAEPVRVYPERELPPKPAERDSAVNQAAQKVGAALGAAREKVEDLRARFVVIRGRGREQARATAEDLRANARRQYHQARTNVQQWAHDKPLAFIAASAGVAFVLGVVLRFWRSHARS